MVFSQTFFEIRLPEASIDLTSETAIQDILNSKQRRHLFHDENVQLYIVSRVPIPSQKSSFNLKYFTSNLCKLEFSVDVAFLQPSSHVSMKSKAVRIHPESSLKTDKFSQKSQQIQQKESPSKNVFHQLTFHISSLDYRFISENYLRNNFIHCCYVLSIPLDHASKSKISLCNHLNISVSIIPNLNSMNPSFFEKAAKEVSPYDISSSSRTKMIEALCSDLLDIDPSKYETSFKSNQNTHQTKIIRHSLGFCPAYYINLSTTFSTQRKNQIYLTVNIENPSSVCHSFTPHESYINIENSFASLLNHGSQENQTLKPGDQISLVFKISPLTFINNDETSSPHNNSSGDQSSHIRVLQDKIELHLIATLDLSFTKEKIHSKWDFNLNQLIADRNRDPSDFNRISWTSNESSSLKTVYSNVENNQFSQRPTSLFTKTDDLHPMFFSGISKSRHSSNNYRRAQSYQLSPPGLLPIDREHPTPSLSSTFKPLHSLNAMNRSHSIPHLLSDRKERKQSNSYNHNHRTCHSFDGFIVKFSSSPVLSPGSQFSLRMELVNLNTTELQLSVLVPPTNNHPHHDHPEFLSSKFVKNLRPIPPLNSLSTTLSFVPLSSDFSFIPVLEITDQNLRVITLRNIGRFNVNVHNVQ